MYQIFMYVPNIKNKTPKQTQNTYTQKLKNLKPGKLRINDPPITLVSQHINFCKDTVCLLTLKCLFFKKLVAFYTAIQSS